MMETVALYVPNLLGGGAQRVMVTLANEFSEKELNVDLVVASFKGPYCKDVSSNVQIVDLNASRAITSIPKLISYLYRVEPDVLLSTLMYANIVAAYAHAISGSESSFVVRETNAIYKSGKKRRRLITKLAKWAYRYADHVIGVSKGLTEEIVDVFGLPKKRVTSIHNPVCSLNNSVPSKPSPCEIQSGQEHVLAVGSLSPQKDFPTLLHAFSKVHKNRNVRLIILGEGEEREALEKLSRGLGVHEDVIMPGFVSNPFDYMNVADVFVLSSQWEGCPNVLIEAMGCGCQVVSTDCPYGAAEILQQGKLGRLVPVKDEKALAITDTLNSPRVNSGNLVKRAKDFAPEKVASQYLEVIGEGT
jgi:glycosyltransferase involved in cell wall biosynthesis